VLGFGRSSPASSRGGFGGGFWVQKSVGLLAQASLSRWLGAAARLTPAAFAISRRRAMADWLASVGRRLCDMARLAKQLAFREFSDAARL
jgi:hypothetical protein